MATLIRAGSYRSELPPALNRSSVAAQSCKFYVSFSDPDFIIRDVVWNQPATFKTATPQGWGIARDPFNINRGTCYYNDGQGSTNRTSWPSGTYITQLNLQGTIAIRANITQMVGSSSATQFGDGTGLNVFNDASGNNWILFTQTTDIPAGVSSPALAVDFGVWRTYVGRYASGILHSMSKFDDRGSLLAQTSTAPVPTGSLIISPPLFIFPFQGFYDFIGMWSTCLSDTKMAAVIRQRQLTISPTKRQPQQLLAGSGSRIPFVLFHRMVV